MKQLHKIAHWKLVLILCITTTILASCLFTMCFGRLNLNPDATMDSMSYYTAETFYQSIEIHSPPAAAIFVLY